MDQKIPTVSENQNSPSWLSGDCGARSFVFCRSLFVLFHLAIILSVLLFMVSDYPFGIFKLVFLVHDITHDFNMMHTTCTTGGAATIYPSGVSGSIVCLFVFFHLVIELLEFDLRVVITPLVLSNLSYLDNKYRL